MQGFITSILTQLAGLLGGAGRFAKAVVPAALAVAIAVVNAAFSGSVNAASLYIAVTGLLAAIVTYFVPNVVKS